MGWLSEDNTSDLLIPGNIVKLHGFDPLSNIQESQFQNAPGLWDVP